MTLGYKVTIRPQHEREHIIQALSATPIREISSYDVFDGTSTNLKIVRLPIDLPIYRMANGRTATHQLAYINENGAAADFFTNGEENDVVQQAQHNILKEFATEGTEQITPILDVLKRDKQREPIWITPRGVVVNGNRRLAAMREAFKENPTGFPEFAEVDCAVLPALTADQIVDIEIRLQMTPETKLPYGWIDECLMIQKQLAAGKSDAQVARVMRSRPKDVRASISALKEADIYLKDWRKKEGDYRLVEDAQQFFYDLPGRLKGKSGDLLEASRRIAWLLIDNSNDLGQRVYAFNDMFGSKVEEVLSKLSERIDVGIEDSEAAESGDTTAEENGDDLDVDLGEDPAPASTIQPIIAAFDDPERREEIKDELVVVCQTILDAGKSAKQGKNALSAVRDANTRLAEIDLTKADPSTYAGIDKQLTEVLSRAQDLKSKLTPYLDNSSSASAPADSAAGGAP